jgi:hypothetical protein
MYNYTEKVSGSHIFIGYYDEFKDVELLKEVTATCQKNGFSMQVLSSPSETIKAPSDKPYKIAHVIVRIKACFDSGLIKDIMKIDIGEHNSASIAFSYTDNNSAITAIDFINLKKIEFGDCLNIMRPDIIHDGLWTVSPLKILDNIICDTVRVKYAVMCLSNKPCYENMVEENIDFFKSASRLFCQYGMFHRSPSDGYFAIRSESGFYITSTKTMKNREFDISRISEVINYDELSNTISYRGKYLPSSDAVEAAIIFKTLPQVHSLIHTHDSVRFTRNSELKEFSLVGCMPYGEAELGHELVKKIIDEEAKLIVMQEHGEVFVGSIKFSAVDYLKTRLI